MSTKQYYDELESLFARHFVVGAALCSTDCACGRTHFVSARGHGDYAENELERLKELAASNPDKYVEETQFDHIDHATVRGVGSLVVDCPCQRAASLAGVVSQNAERFAAMLVDLLRNRAKDASETERRCIELAAKLSLFAEPASRQAGERQ